MAKVVRFTQVGRRSYAVEAVYGQDFNLVVDGRITAHSDRQAKVDAVYTALVAKAQAAVA